MYASNFQLYKVQRLIQRQGHQFNFIKEGVNKFGEPNGQTESIYLNGVYHEQTRYLSKSSPSEASTVRTKVTPMILCLWKDAIQLPSTATLQYNNKTYTVNGIVNIEEANLIAEISLEEVLSDG